MNDEQLKRRMALMQPEWEKWVKSDYYKAVKQGVKNGKKN